MVLSLPASIQELVGRRLTRISISWPQRDRIIFDTQENSSSQRTRYAYSITGTVDRFYNLSEMVGYIVTEVLGLDMEANGQYKMAVKTQGQQGFGVIYFSNLFAEEGRITEDGEQRVLEQEGEEECFCRLTEESGTADVVVVANVDVGRNPPYKISSDNRAWVVEEGDVNYGTGFGLAALDCDGECTPYVPADPLSVVLLPETESDSVLLASWEDAVAFFEATASGGSGPYTFAFSLEDESTPGVLSVFEIGETSPLGNASVFFTDDPGMIGTWTATVKVIATDSTLATAEDTAVVELTTFGV